MEDLRPEEKKPIAPGAPNLSERLENETLDQFIRRMEALGRPVLCGADLLDDKGKDIRDTMTEYIGKDREDDNLFLVKPEFVDTVNKWIEERNEQDRLDFLDDYDDYDW